MNRAFHGKKVFVSGGTSGINLAITVAFAATGATLGVLSLGAFHATHGAIDVLVNGAAGNFIAPALGMSPNGLCSVVAIDLLGSFHVLRAAHASLAKPGACVVNISASHAQTLMMMQTHVCAAKAGADMIISALALEQARNGIRLNSIAPGPVAGTEGMARLAYTPDAECATRARIPFGRYSCKEDIAAIALFLCSDAAAMITGQVLAVDGDLNVGRYSPGHAAQTDQGMAARARGG